jgi:FkbM family methyltransferase
MAEAAARVCFAYLRNQHGMRTRRPLPRYLTRTAIFLAASPFVPFLEASMGPLRVLLSTSDRTIARSVFAAGDWDPLLVGTVFEALDQLGYRYRERTFVEVGANFGVYALPAVAQYGFARAVAFEPEPDAFALLTRNIERNALGHRVRAFQRALSANPGELVLTRAVDNAGDNRITAEGEQQAGHRASVAVPASTFDHEVAAGSLALDEIGLVWLDVQGHEFDVLVGAKTLLASSVPVVVEYTTSMMAPANRRLLNELIADNYRALVDLGWSALTNRIRFQPAWAIHDLAPGRAADTDLLLL